MGSNNDTKLILITVRKRSSHSKQLSHSPQSRCYGDTDANTVHKYDPEQKLDEVDEM